MFSGEPGLVYFVHGIFLNQLVLHGKGEDYVHRAIVVVNILGRKFLVCAQIDEKFLDICGHKLLEDTPLKIADDVLFGVLVESDSFRLVLPVVHADREPIMLYERDKVCGSLSKLPQFGQLGIVHVLFVFSTDFFFPSICGFLSGSLCLGRGKLFGDCPGLASEYLLARFIPRKR